MNGDNETGSVRPDNPGQSSLTATVTRQAQGFCDGRFSYQVAWQIDSLTDGVIIQHVVWTIEVADCDNEGRSWSEGEIKNSLGFPDEVSFEYWEAWTVNATDRRIDPDDADTVQIVSGFNHTTGTMRVTLSAAFYEGMTLPEDFQTGRGFAGANPSTFVDPSLPPPASAPVQRIVSVSWVCKDGEPGDANCTNTQVEVG